MGIPTTIKTLRSNFSLTRAFIALTCVLMLGVWYGVSLFLNRETILPGAKDRYDVTQIYLAPVKDICPQISADLTGPEIEACTKDLSLADGLRPAGLQAVTIPTLSDIYRDGSPKLSVILKKHHADLAERLIKNREPYILGFKVPAELWTKRAATHSYSSLVFSQIDSAIFCSEGRCSAFADRIKYGTQQIPLVRDSDLPKGEVAPLWAVGKATIEWGFVMSLADGVFIAKNEQMMTANLYYQATLNLDRLQYAFLFTGVFLLVVWLAWVWHRYLDFAAFAAVAMAFAAAGIYVVFSTLLAGQLQMSNEGRYGTTQIIWGVCFASLVAFAITSMRLSAGRTVKWAGLAFSGFVVVGLGASSLNIVHSSFFDPRKVQLTFGILAFLVPALICYGGAFRFYRQRQDNQSTLSTLSTDLTMKNRMTQQMLLGVLLQLFTLQPFINALLILSGQNAPPAFSTLSAAAFILMLGTLIRPVMMRLSLAMQLAPFATEASKLRLLLTPEKYRAWKSASRQGLLLDFDLQGSSVAGVELKQKMLSLMRILKTTVSADLAKQGIPVLMSKPMGDSRIFVIELAPAQAQDYLRKAIAMITANLSTYVSAVQSAQAELLGKPKSEIPDVDLLGLHVRLYVVSRFWLSGSSGDKGTQGAADKDEDDDLDFYGDELNHEMKYTPKPPVNSIGITGPRPMIAPILGELSLTVSEPIALAAIMGKAKSPVTAAIEDARASELNFWTISCPVKTDEAPHHDQAS